MRCVLACEVSQAVKTGSMTLRVVQILGKERLRESFYAVFNRL